ILRATPLINPSLFVGSVSCEYETAHGGDGELGGAVFDVRLPASATVPAGARRRAGVLLA
ncbi:hypothetical protein ACEN85_12375, partial [Curtobacterium sp. CT11-45]|uniref:hypothetical protein n=1 Tax=Curtobacterium sp. CT11-45 TaxID=3243037 RepID=UPI0039B0620B